jgi:uncharacterized protein YdhG (YjbR/CyaY superfamily)
MNTKILTVTGYITTQALSVVDKLNTIRQLIVDTCPDVVESISYGMPAYKYHNKPLIYFAAFPHHIGIYATPSANIAFAKQLSGYKQGKGSVQIPLDQDLPLGLIRDIIVFNMHGIKPS